MYYSEKSSSDDQSSDWMGRVFGSKDQPKTSAFKHVDFNAPSDGTPAKNKTKLEAVRTIR